MTWPVAQLLKLYFIFLPVQRFLLALGCASALIGALAYWPFGAPVAIFGVFAGLGALLVVLPLTVSSGYASRVLSTPRAHRLLPGFRPRLLMAGALVTVSVAGIVALFVFAIDGTEEALRAFLYMAAIFSLVHWFLFFVNPGSLAATISILGVLAAARVLFEPPFPDFSPGTVLVVVAVALVAGWGVLARWYLRGPVIRPMHAAFGGLVRESSRPAVEHAPHSARSAMVTSLRGGPFSRVAAVLWGAAMMALVIAAFAAVGGATSARGVLAMPFVFVLATAFSATRLGARTRLIWLKHPNPREGLFGVVEKELLTTDLALLTAGLLVTFVFAVFLAPHAVTAFPLILLCAVASGLCGAYLALGWIQGPRLLDYGIGACWLAGVAAAGIATLLEPVRVDALLAVSAVQAAGALIGRSASRRRWRTVDWLHVRPARPLRQA